MLADFEKLLNSRVIDSGVLRGINEYRRHQENWGMAYSSRWLRRA